jgi:predicted nucleotidyltransferase
MKYEDIELKLIKNLLTNINFSNNTIRKLIEPYEILGLYVYGSRLWGSTDENSDLDYCVIVDNNSSIFEFTDEFYIQKESEDIDLHVMSETKYKEFVEECNDMALSMYFQESPLLKYDYKTEINLINLRKYFSSKANNSYVKAKKKLTVEDKSEENFRIAYKSMYHSIRILEFGENIALAQINDTKIYDFTSFGKNIEWIIEEFQNNKENWEYLHELFKPIYNKYASDFKKLAPKA